MYFCDTKRRSKVTSKTKKKKRFGFRFTFFRFFVVYKVLRDNGFDAFKLVILYFPPLKSLIFKILNCK